MPRVVCQITGAIIFVASFVALAKASQYAAVTRLGDRIGFEAASMVGLVPVIFLAFVVDRKRRLARRHDTPAIPIA
jgi:hypothetical protein